MLATRPNMAPAATHGPRPEAAADLLEVHALRDPLATPRPVQRFKVPTDHVRADLRHAVGKKLFKDHTIVDIQGRVHVDHPFEGVSNRTLEGAVEASRDARMMDYAQLRMDKVTSEKQLTGYLNDRQEDEHMYVLHNDNVHVAIRAEAEKLPHPTLVGGDPDVSCAGTMRWGGDGEVLVTNGSGHFRPPSATPGQQAVDKIMHKTASKGRTRKVKVGRR